MALIKTTDELAKYIKVDVNMKIAKMQSSIETAELDCVKPLLGEEFYVELLDAYNAGPLTDPELIAVLPYVQKALAFYAASLSVEELGVSVGDMGIQQQFGQNSQPAPSWKVTQLKQKYITTADKAADLLLEFLEMAAVIPPGGMESDRIYKKWYDDPTANTSLSGAIVYKTSIASKYIDIGGSRRLFLRLKKRIKEIEESAIKKIICTDQYNTLITQLKDPSTITDENRALIAKLEPIIAKRALYSTLPMLPVIITTEGLFIQTDASLTAGLIQKLQASSSDKAALMQQLREAEDIGYLADEARLHDFLLENIDDYPEISGSPCWVADITQTNDVWKIDNLPCDKHFST